MPSLVQCVICGNESGTVVWTERGYEGRYCPCGSVYTFPAPEPGEVDFTYDGHPACFYSDYAGLKARWVKNIKSSGRLLEVGCGEGYFLAAAKALGYDVAGIDANPDRVARVARSLYVNVRCGLFEELEFTERYDLVYHCDLLSHFPDPVAALRKMGSILSPGGILACEVGTLARIHTAWYRWIGLIGYPQHRWLYSEESLHLLFEKAGLRILRLRHFGLAPSVLLYRSRVLLGKLARPVLRRGRSVKRLRSARPLKRDSVTREGSSFERLEQFFRYRVGALAPRIGPGTLFIAAEPIE